MSNLGKLILVLVIAVTIAIVGLSKKLADAKVKSIQQTIEQQFNEGVEQ